MNPNKADLTGKVFGRLTAIQVVKVSRGAAMWRCKCSCGGARIVSATALVMGRTKSCGDCRHGGAVRPVEHDEINTKIGPRKTFWLGAKQARIDDARRAAHAAALKEAGTYVSPEVAIARTIGRMKEAASLPPPPLSIIGRVAPALHSVRRQIVDLSCAIDASRVTTEDEDALNEVAIHLGRLAAAIKDIDRLRNERALARGEMICR